MEFNVAQLMKAPVGESRAYDINEDIGEFDGTSTATPLTGRVRLVRMPATILVEARLKTDVALYCSRCLEDLVQPLKIEFVEEYEPTIDIDTGAPIEGLDDEQRFRIDQNHTLDLAGAVREYGLLAIPMQPTCAPDCRGLCPTCGQNLNVAQCSCRDRNVDSRLAVLRELLEENE